jgi:tripartite-type tricarboxylate transporter receptor subunit TctC
LFNTTVKGTYKREDFAWITRLQLDPFAIYVAAESPVRTLKDFVDLANARARSTGPRLSVGGSLGIGGAHNIAFNIFAKAANIEFNWVAVPGTAATLVMGSHVNAGHGNLAPVDQLVKAGKLRLLGVSTAKRVASFPDVPTYGEAGYKYDTRWIQVRGLYAHKDVPKPVQERLVSLIQTATRSDAWQKYMHDSNQLDGFQGPQAYTRFVAEQEEITVDWLKRLGVIK